MCEITIKNDSIYAIIYKMNKKQIKNKQGGFLQLIIFLIIVVLVLGYFNINIHTVVNYIITAFHNVFG